MKCTPLIPAVILLVLATATSALADEAACNNLVQTSTKKAMMVFHDTHSNVQEKRQQLATIFKQAVDIDWIGRYVLGRHWKTATPAQQQTYLKLYRDYLANGYIGKFDDEDGLGVDAIKVVSITLAASGGFEAKTLIQSKGDEDVHVDYLLDDTGGTCKVHDVRVEGVSLLISQRSEFANVANNAGVEGIIALMQKLPKN